MTALALSVLLLQDNPIQGMTAEAMLELLQVKTGLRFAYDETETLKGVRLYALIKEADLSDDMLLDVAQTWFQQSGIALIKRGGKKDAYYQVLNLNFHRGQPLPPLPNFRRLEDLPEFNEYAEFTLELETMTAAEALALLGARRPPSGYDLALGRTLTLVDHIRTLRAVVPRLQELDRARSAEVELVILKLSGDGAPRIETLPESLRGAFELLQSRFRFAECAVAGGGRISAASNPKTPATLTVGIDDDRWRLEFQLDDAVLSQVSLGKRFERLRSDVTGTGIVTTVFDHWDSDVRVQTPRLSVRPGQFELLGSWSEKDGATRVALLRLTR